ncbi:MAG: hypothetical protein JW720_00215 [Sedimentisphaerales bacterium]|nr:hypothetical protein [Sedimentisphaerales bacterium]
MAGSHRKSPSSTPVLKRTEDSGLDLGRAGALRTSIFFVLFYLYLWLYLDLRLIYYSAGMVTYFPAFFRGWSFLLRFTAYPGGLAEYAGAFTAQLFYYSWTAALVITLEASAICLCSGYFLDVVKASSIRWLRFAVPILLVVICSQYTYHFAATVAITAALLGVCLYIRITQTADAGENSGKWMHRLRPGLLFLGLSVVVYYATGGAYLVFAVLCAVRELRFKRLWLAVLCLLSAVVIPYVEGVVLFGVCPAGAFTETFPASWKISFLKKQSTSMSPTYAVYLIVCVGVFAAGLWRFVAGSLFRKNKAGKTEQRKSRNKGSKSLLPPKALPSTPGHRGFRWAIESILMFAIVGVAAFFSHNSKREDMLKIHYYTCRRMWTEVLKTAGHNSTNYFAINAVNRALYHTGRLGSEMFAYPQHPDALLLTGEDQVLLCWHKFDTQLDLGLVNMAQKNLTECMEVYGEHPLILERLALTNMVKGNINAARVYLAALTKTIFHAGRARDYLSLLSADPGLSTDDYIQSLRAVAMKRDFHTIFFEPEMMYLVLLTENSKNRMAFEYLMATHMLKRQLDRFIRNLKWCKGFEDSQFPRHYEEAICIYAYGTQKPVFLHGRSLDPQVRRQAEQFGDMFNRYRQDKKAAINPLAQAYGGTYFFYNLYGFSGVKK